MKENKKLKPWISFLKPNPVLEQCYPYRKGQLFLFLAYRTNPKYYPYREGIRETSMIMAQCVGTGEIVYVLNHILVELTGAGEV